MAGLDYLQLGRHCPPKRETNLGDERNKRSGQKSQLSTTVMPFFQAQGTQQTICFSAVTYIGQENERHWAHTCQMKRKVSPKSYLSAPSLLLYQVCVHRDRPLWSLTLE